jgi:hypothetical protein
MSPLSQRPTQPRASVLNQNFATQRLEAVARCRAPATPKITPHYLDCITNLQNVFRLQGFFGAAQESGEVPNWRGFGLSAFSGVL